MLFSIDLLEAKSTVIDELRGVDKDFFGSLNSNFSHLVIDFYLYLQ